MDSFFTLIVLSLYIHIVIFLHINEMYESGVGYGLCLSNKKFCN